MWERKNVDRASRIFCITGCRSLRDQSIASFPMSGWPYDTAIERLRFGRKGRMRLKLVKRNRQGVDLSTPPEPTSLEYPPIIPMSLTQSGVCQIIFNDWITVNPIQLFGNRPMTTTHPDTEDSMKFCETGNRSSTRSFASVRKLIRCRLGVVVQDHCGAEHDAGFVSPSGLVPALLTRLGTVRLGDLDAYTIEILCTFA
ncbi:uncharacterized protein BDR25DRAFT_350547 [Lindgomyces ingoldianus]|uniref:Uncharacterized protein n=1 Tax=Lindgomyces ingoldianus TaxID=673940 RepID=A0ACB6R9D9_9PLEO|nr:uncharacterized protein BDR25DRAFT_350547 [Lindgomyces ingoldianus]KAF2475137.1 hypothetical protein BDR25DRAFT_350547 [Lindgomyces ingoldianus]